MGKLSEKKEWRGGDKEGEKAKQKGGGKALVVNERPTHRNRVYISQGFRKGWL